jgi:hypothetical protein
MHTLLVLVPRYISRWSSFSDTAASMTPDTHGGDQCDDNATHTNRIETREIENNDTDSVHHAS